MFSKASQTVKFTVTQKYKNESYIKTWKLLTYKDMINNKNHVERKEEMLKIFMERENGIIGNYRIKSTNSTKITTDNYL